MHNFISTIKQLADQNPDILIVWLYGSRAKGNAHRNSDYDLAMAFKSAKQRPFNRIERRAAQRALQVLIEASIGMAKYWLKSCSTKRISRRGSVDRIYIFNRK